MHTKRIIPCLDVNNGRVVKGVNFVNLQDAGDPVALAKFYSDQGADEIVFLDITATSDGRATVADVVERTAGQVFVPLTVGGGIRTLEDFQLLLQRLAREDYTILISSHILSELADLCTSIGVINGGVMVQQGKLENIMLAIDSSNPLRITVLNQVPKALELLRQDPQVSRLSVDENKIAAWFSGSREEEAYLLQKLVDAGILVVSFAREHNSLESLFFHLTGETEQKSRNTETFGNTIG